MIFTGLAKDPTNIKMTFKACSIDCLALYVNSQMTLEKTERTPIGILSVFTFCFVLTKPKRKLFTLSNLYFSFCRL